MTLRLFITLLPLALGWALAAVLQFKALDHLRSAKGWARLFAFVGGPFSASLYTLEGFRYRGLALLSFVLGIIGTVILAILLEPHS